MHRIMVVDDHVDLSLAIVALIETANCKAIAVSDGASALRLLAEQTFDGVILDNHMPVMSGLEVLRRIRGGTIAVPPPVIMYSADEATRGPAMTLGAVAFISKAQPADELINAIHAAVGCN